MKVVPANYAARYGAPRTSGPGGFLLCVVGSDLRRLYGDVAAAPLPEAMTHLVEKLTKARDRLGD